VSATTATESTLERIARLDGGINAYTAVLADHARAQARAVDADPKPGPLAGMTFAVKNLYDIEGLTTLAGSLIEADRPAAAQDAPLVARLKRAGGVLLGALNMDEYAYGFTTENSHYGATRNPHDLSRISGGSSGGSAAAVAAGLATVSLGSDTNGSIRVPASFCGVYGLKPTFGRLTRRGTMPFVHSLDHTGPFARSIADLAAAYDVLQGPDALDPVCAQRPSEPVSDGLQVSAPLKAATLGGFFAHGAAPEVLTAVAAVAKALDAAETVDLPNAKAARSAAFCLTAAEGGSLHMDNLRRRPGDFDPATRDRLIAGSLQPAPVVAKAQRLRRQFLQEALALLERYDLLLAPATPFAAQPIGQSHIELNGESVLIRAVAGMFAQPISFIGLPVLTVPITNLGGLPVGVQLIAAPWREDRLFAAAARLERLGVCGAVAPESLAP
jgi:AtzE family amidohydrolase